MKSRYRNLRESNSIITKIALNLLKNNTLKKRSIKKKRLLCGWDNDYLAKTVFKEIYMRLPCRFRL
jgi:hypothetical protein